MRIYCTACDQGDGSMGVEFYDSQECIDKLEEFMPEQYRGDRGIYFDCDNFSQEVYTMEDVNEAIAIYNGD